MSAKKQPEKNKKPATPPGPLVPPLAVYKHLKKLAQRNRHQYAAAITQLLQQWPHKTPAEIKDVCRQVQAVIARSRPMAEVMFGKAVVRFFESFEPEQINFK
jgi:hypothetical protein